MSLNGSQIGAGIEDAPESRRIAVDRFVGKLSATEACKVLQSLRVLGQVGDERLPLSMPKP